MRASCEEKGGPLLCAHAASGVPNSAPWPCTHVPQPGNARCASLLSASLPCSEMYPARWVPPKVLPHWLVMAVLRLRGDDGCVLAPLEAAHAARLLCSLMDGRGMHGYDCPLHFQMLCPWLSMWCRGIQWVKAEYHKHKVDCSKAKKHLGLSLIPLEQVCALAAAAQAVCTPLRLHSP